MKQYGIDISNHNRDFVLNTNMGKHLISTADFVWMKATEGRNFVDKSVCEYVNEIVKLDKRVVGFYHYARPDLNKATDEAEHFVETVCNLSRLLHDNCVILTALDWESLSLSFSPEWAEEWASAVSKKVGIKPLIYLSESVAQSSEWDGIVSMDVGLWVAKWSDVTPRSGAWPFYAFHQYNSSPIDMNVFNGSCEQLIKYGTNAINI